MHTENSIIMRAPLEKIWETVGNLALWPQILPHYRYIKYLEQSPEKSRVVMAAKRNWIPVKWESYQEIDRSSKEVRFYHLKAFTKGMVVVWRFKPVDDGVEVQILHDKTSRIPFLGKLISEQIIGKFFVQHIADQTLLYMKNHLEQLYGK